MNFCFCNNNCFDIYYCGFSHDYIYHEKIVNTVAGEKNEQINEISSITTLSERFVQQVHSQVSE